MKVLIVGGGLGGCCLALGLARHGIQCEIFESRKERGDIGGAISLAPNAIRVLDVLGVWDDLKSQGHLFEVMHMVTSDGSAIGTFKNGSEQAYGYRALRLRRSRLHETLLAHLDKYHPDTVTLHMGVKVTDVSSTDSSATLTTSDGHKVTGDYVIGADGIHSTIRRFVSPDSPEPQYQGVVSIGTLVPGSKLGSYPLPCMVYGRTGTVGLMPSGAPDEDTASLFVTLEMERERNREGWQAMSLSGEALRMAKAKVEGWNALPDLIQELEKDPSSCLLWPQYMVPDLEHWYHNRVILIGDAAHAIPPNGGQGAAQAFEDAALLARCLADNGSLDKWENERKRRIQVVKTFTGVSGDSRKVGKASWLAFEIKKWGMWAYFRFFGGGERGDLYNYDGATVDIV